MKAETLLQVAEFVKASTQYQEGKIDFVADVIDVKGEKIYTYNFTIFSTESKTAFYYVQLAAAIEVELHLGCYFRINTRNELVLEVI